MVAMLSSDEHILTISKYGMAKRSRLGTAEKIHDSDASGEPKYEDDGSPKMGYGRLSSHETRSEGCPHNASR